MSRLGPTSYKVTGIYFLPKLLTAELFKNISDFVYPAAACGACGCVFVQKICNFGQKSEKYKLCQLILLN